MKNGWILLSAFCFLLFIMPVTAFAQGKDSVVTDPGPRGAAATEPVGLPIQYRVAMHGLLDQLCGPWMTEAEFWPQGPAGLSVRATGRSDWHMILGGRFMQMTDSLNTGTSPWSSQGFMGWDEDQQRLTLTAFSSAEAGQLSATGRADDSARVFTFEGRMPELFPPLRGDLSRYVLSTVNGNHRVLRVFHRRAGAEQQVAEIHYRRGR